MILSTLGQSPYDFAFGTFPKKPHNNGVGVAHILLATLTHFAMRNVVCIPTNLPTNENHKAKDRTNLRLPQVSMELI